MSDAVQPSVEHAVQPLVEHAVQPSVEHAVQPLVEHAVQPLVELVPKASLIDVVISEESTVSKLTEQQRIIVQTLYESAKKTSESLLTDTTLDSSIKITQLIAQLMAFMEQVNLGGEKISGANKKAVVLELGRLLIKDHIKDNVQRVKILLMYDVLAEKTLEVMIDVSHLINKQVAKATASCWDCLVSLWK